MQRGAELEQGSFLPESRFPETSPSPRLITGTEVVLLLKRLVPEESSGAVCPAKQG